MLHLPLTITVYWYTRAFSLSFKRLLSACCLLFFLFIPKYKLMLLKSPTRTTIAQSDNSDANEWPRRNVFFRPKEKWVTRIIHDTIYNIKKKDWNIIYCQNGAHHVLRHAHRHNTKSLLYKRDRHTRAKPHERNIYHLILNKSHHNNKSKEKWKET